MPRSTESIYVLTRDQLAAHIPYDQAEGIAQLNSLGHTETLIQAINGQEKAELIKRVVERINEINVQS